MVKRNYRSRGYCNWEGLKTHPKLTLTVRHDTQNCLHQTLSLCYDLCENVTNMKRLHWLYCIADAWTGFQIKQMGAESFKAGVIFFILYSVPVFNQFYLNLMAGNIIVPLLIITT